MRIFFCTKLFFLFLSGLLYAQPGSVYTVQKTVQGQAQKNGQINSVTFAILDNNKKIYEIKAPVAYDVPFPRVKTFDNGSSVLIDAFAACLTFYENSGIETSKMSIIKDNDIEYERYVYSAINEKSLVIALNQPGLDYTLIQLYNNDGQFIRQTEVTAKHINGLEYSAKLDLIALSVYDWSQNVLKKEILFINSRGVHSHVDDMNFSSADFIEEEDIFTGYSNNSSFIFDLAANKVLFAKQARKGEMILSAQLINDQFSVVETINPALKKGHWYYQNPVISQYSKDGRLIRTNLIECSPFMDYHFYLKDSDLVLQTENETIHIR